MAMSHSAVRVLVKRILLRKCVHMQYFHKLVRGGREKKERKKKSSVKNACINSAIKHIIRNFEENKILTGCVKQKENTEMLHLKRQKVDYIDSPIATSLRNLHTSWLSKILSSNGSKLLKKTMPI